jgi:hypothetical protein
MWISSVKFCPLMTTRSLDNFIPPGKPELGDPSGDRSPCEVFILKKIESWIPKHPIDERLHKSLDKACMQADGNYSARNLLDGTCQGLWMVAFMDSSPQRDNRLQVRCPRVAG